MIVWTQLELFLYYIIIFVIVLVFILVICFIRREAHQDFLQRSKRYKRYIQQQEQQEQENMFMEQYRYFEQLFFNNHNEFNFNLSLRSPTSP